MFGKRCSQGFSAGIAAAALGMMLLPSSCIQGEAVAKPPEIHYGEDMCANCGMIISDARFASAYAYEIEPGRYESLIFDDIGDMVFHIKANQDQKITDFWVHDHDSEEWIDATSAYFIVSPQIKSPMMHGVAAFAAKEAAQALADEVDGEVFDWDHMRAQILLHNH